MYTTHIPLRLCALLALIAAQPTWGQAPPANTLPADARSTGQSGAASPAAPAASPAREVPRPDQLEPGVDTSAAPAGSPTAAPGNVPGLAPGSTPAGKAPAAPEGNTAPQQSKASAQDKGQTGRAPSRAGAPGKAQDRIELDTTQITGNRELPKVLYIVPWKRSDLGDLVGKPVNSLLDEVLAPVDRDVFKRENRYYDALKPDQAHAPAAGPPEGNPGSGTPAAPPAGEKH